MVVMVLITLPAVAMMLLFLLAAITTLGHVIFGHVVEDLHTLVFVQRRRPRLRDNYMSQKAPVTPLEI
jgi:hypothetical protein